MKNLVLCIIILISLAVAGCKKDSPSPDNPAGYKIETGTVTGITKINATISGSLKSVNGTNIISYGHVWSTSKNPTTNLSTKTVFGPLNADANFTSDLTKLQQGSVYYVRAYSIDNAGTFYGEEISFTTVASFFEFVVSSTYIEDDDYLKQRDWVLIYNADNELLGIQELSNGNAVSFDWPASKQTDQYMVQLFLYNDYVNPEVSDTYYVRCYKNVKPDVWYLGTEPANEYPKLGTNLVTLSDLDLYSCPFYSTKNLYAWADYDQFSQTLEFSQYFNPDKIWITYFSEEQAPFYKWFGNVNLNQNFTVSSSDFTQMTSYVDISLPPNEHSTVYIESEDNLNTDFWEYFEICLIYSGGMTTVRTYYPDSLFPGYYTDLQIYRSNIRERMVKFRGTIPTQMVQMPVDVSIINEAINGFNAEYSGDADIVDPFWSGYEVTEDLQHFYYFLYGSKNDIRTFSAPALPEEIRSLNESLLDLSKLNYEGTTFTDYNYYSDYNDYIMESFVQPGVTPDTKEFYNSKTIYKKPIKARDMVNELDDLQPVKRKRSR